MKYIINRSIDPYFNMALDEFCLTELKDSEPFFYLWRNRPAVIIGINQNAYSEVNLNFLLSQGITLARRVTGGGAVYHDFQNLNYSFVGKGVSPEPIVAALRSFGLDAELTGRNDIFVDGRKVSGYARRLVRDRELIHGTLMYNVDIDTLTKVLDVDGSKFTAKGVASVRSRVANLKSYLPFASLDELQAELQTRLAGEDGLRVGAEELIGKEEELAHQELEVLGLSEAQLERVRHIAAEKFATWEWVYAHSKEFSLKRSAHLDCGTVEVALNIEYGIITAIDFRGDFIGERPAEELGIYLLCCRYDKVALAERLGINRPSTSDFLPCSQYFSGASNEQILDLLIG